MQKAQQLAQLGIPLAERVLLPHVMEVTKALYAGLSWGGAGREVGLLSALGFACVELAAFPVLAHAVLSSLPSHDVCCRLVCDCFAHSSTTWLWGSSWMSKQLLVLLDYMLSLWMPPSISCEDHPLHLRRHEADFRRF